MISNADTYFLTDGRFEAGLSASALTSDPARKADLLSTAMLNTVQTLQADGHDVLLFQAVLHWDDGLGVRDWDPAQCRLTAILTGDCSARQALDQAIAQKKTVRSVLSNVASSSGAGIWDPLVAMCPDGWCSTASPSFTRYHDPFHISVPQSVALVPDLREAIKER